MGAQVFVSYRRTQSERVRPVVAALEAAGLEVFFDQDDIDPLADFPQRIRDGLDRSHAALIWWSADYADSDICLQELRLAWQHARRHSSDLARRVWILNPESDGRHIEAGELAAGNYLVPPAPEAADAWARQLAEKAALLVPEGPLADEHGGLPCVGVYGAPVRSPRFTGRGRELWRIHRLLHPARVGGALKGVAVRTHGLGGIGKTELAAAYVEDFAAAYPGGVYWLSLAAYAPPVPGIETAESVWLDALARALAGHPWLADDPPELRLADAEGKTLPAGVVRARLAGLLGERASLWVLDNVPTLRPEDLRARILDAWAAPGSHGRTLVTTRDSRPVAGYGEIPLDVLDEDDAQRLLARFRKPANPAEADAARKLAAEVGRHTLALTLLGHRVQQAVLGYRGVLADLHARGRLPRMEEIAEHLRPSLGEGARGLLATFAGSIDPLSEPARRLLALAAACAPGTPIPPALLADAYARLDGAPDDDTDRADQVDSGLLELAEACLLARRKGGENFLEIHPLLAEAAPALLGSAAEGAESVLADTLLDRVAEAENFRSHSELAGVIPHARILALTRNDENAVTLALRVGQFETTRGSYRAALEMDTRARNLAERILGAEHTLTLQTINNLANSFADVGDPAAARDLHERVLLIRRRVLGEDHPDTLTSMNNLANTLVALGDAAGARDLHERALALRRRVLGEMHIDTLQSMGNLAVALLDLGDAVGARDLQERALAMYLQVLGEEHPDTLTSMNNLAATLRALGDATGARDLHERELGVCRRVLGEEHPDTLRSMNNLAAALLALGDGAGARDLHERALAVYRRVLGEDHPDTLTSMNNLANTLVALGDGAGARDLQQRALAVRRRVLGEEHPDTRLSAWNLFTTLLDLGEAGAARGIFEAHLAGLLDRDPAALAAQDRTIRERLLAWLESQAAPPPAEPAPEAPARGWLARFGAWLSGR